jgi:hypothetical protein
MKKSDSSRPARRSPVTSKSARDVLARMTAIPPDTRDNTGKLLGDPIPERSALFQKQRDGHA